MIRTTTFLLCGLAAAVSASAETVIRSGPQRVALIELYTSEGCSSCPPAEDWLSALRGDPALWRAFVPIAFHVTYWDRLGWRDPFAAKAYSERQYKYADTWRAESVYTPCLVKDGREWHPAGASPDLAGAKEKPGVLTLTWPKSGRALIDFATEAGTDPEKLEAHVALLHGGIVSPVKAGENAGRTLRHEFVVASLQSTRLTRAADGHAVAELTLPASSETADRAVAVWITLRDSLVPVQAAGGWLAAE
jgi:hypothetical protein